MTENDKILINAFLDNEASSEEIKYVEDLIEKNDEALKYLNMLKKANIEFNNFFDNIDLSKNFKKEKFSFLDLVSQFFQKPILGYTSTALLFFVVGTNIDFMSNQLNTSEEIYFESFSDKNIKMEYLSTKSSSDNINLDKILANSIKEAIDQNSLSATIISGGDVYRFKLNANIINESNVNCFEGHIFSDEKKEFIYCNNNNILSISYK